MKITFLSIAAIGLMAGCTSMSEDATRSNCKMAQDALDLAEAAVFEYQASSANQPLPVLLIDTLNAARLTQGLVCG